MESWVNAAGFEGKYMVSDQGRVMSLPRRGTEGRILSTYVDDGYFYAKLWSENREHRVRVHRLMLMSFVGPPSEENPHALHADDDKTNNVLSNLRWGNDHENTRDRIKNGLHNCARKTHCKHGHEFTPENTYTYRTATGVGRGCRQCIARISRQHRQKRKAGKTGV